MYKAKKIFSFIVFSCLIIAIVVSLGACWDKGKKNIVGKYYLEGSQQIYIEIIDGNYLQFHGVDFSFVDIEEFWGDDAVELLEYFDKTNSDINSCMQGRKKYIFWADNDITVEVVEGSGLALGMQFDGNNTISFNELKYILK